MVVQKFHTHGLQPPPTSKKLSTPLYMQTYKRYKEKHAKREHYKTDFGSIYTFQGENCTKCPQTSSYESDGKLNRGLATRLYSKTSNNGPSEKRTTSVQRTTHLPPIDFTIKLIHFEPPRSGHVSTPNNGH